MSPFFFRHQQLSRFKLIIIAHREGRRMPSQDANSGVDPLEEDGSGIILVEDVWHLPPRETDEVGRGPFDGLMAAREWLADE